MPSERPLPRNRHRCRPGSVPREPPSKSRSALVVSHHLGGFLRSEDRGLVASRCQSWGSPRFVLPGSRSDPAHVPKDRAWAAGVPRHSPRRCSHPSKNSTRPQPHHVTVAVAPLPFPPTSAFPRATTVAGDDVWVRSDRSVGFEALLRRQVRDALRPLPADGRPILPGLCSPSRYISRVAGGTRASCRSPVCVAKIRRKPRPPQELRSASTKLAPRGPHRRAPCGASPMGMAASATPEDATVDHLAPDTDEVPRDLTGREASDGRSRRTPRVDTRSPESERDGVRRGRNPSYGSPGAGASPCSPGPDRSQDPGRRA